MAPSAPRASPYLHPQDRAAGSGREVNTWSLRQFLTWSHSSCVRWGREDGNGTRREDFNAQRRCPSPHSSPEEKFGAITCVLPYSRGNRISFLCGGTGSGKQLYLCDSYYSFAAMSLPFPLWSECLSHREPQQASLN